MLCDDGLLHIGFKSTLFMTFFIDEKSGSKCSINVEILSALARLEGCNGIIFSEFSLSESYCSDQLCVNTLSQAVRNESVFADVDSIQLSDIDVSLFRYSLPVDVPRLVMMEGRPAGMESAIDLRFYAVYIIDTALLLILLLLFGSIVTALKSQLVIDANQNDRLRILCGFIDFLSRMLHLITILLLFLFYQCHFNGNVVLDSIHEQEFASVIPDLLNGTRRLLIDTGVLMENEYSAFGPLTTVIKDERERLERLCNDEDDVALLWDDQMFGLAALNQSLLRNCRLNRIDIPFDTSNHPLPRLERSLENGEYLYGSSRIDSQMNNFK